MKRGKRKGNNNNLKNNKNDLKFIHSLCIDQAANILTACMKISINGPLVNECNPPPPTPGQTATHTTLLTHFLRETRVLLPLEENMHFIFFTCGPVSNCLVHYRSVFIFLIFLCLVLMEALFNVRPSIMNLTLHSMFVMGK